MAEQMTSKACGECGIVKPLGQFHKNRAKANGHQSSCKSCRLACREAPRAKATRAACDKKYRQTTNGKAVRAACAKRYEESPRGKLALRMYRQSHPERVLAMRAVLRAIRSGRIPQAASLACALCGKQAKDYHHRNGYGPEAHLDVIALCRNCHGELHQNGREAHR